MLRSLGDAPRLARQLAVQSGVLDFQYARSLSLGPTGHFSEAPTCSRSQGEEGNPPRYQVSAAHGSSSVSEQGNFHHKQIPCRQEQGLSGSGTHHADLTEYLHEHALRRRYPSHICQHSYQPSNRLAHLHRSFTSNSRAAQQSTASYQSSMREYGVSSPQAPALLTHRQQHATSSCSSTKGFASMPERILQSDGHHDMSSSNRSERGFASASEPSQQSAVSAAEPAQQAFVPPGRVQNAPAPPWTPTRELRKRNFLPRRMGHLMEVLDREAQAKAADEKKFPDFETGDLLELTLVVPENKGREAKVRGICMVKRRRGYRTSFTLLNHIPGGGPVERSFPLYSSTLQGIKVLGRRKVRRAKLYYLRDRKPSEYKV